MHLLQTVSACCGCILHHYTRDIEESCGDVPLYSPGLPRKTDEYKTPLRASFAAAARASAGEGHSLRVVHHLPAETNDYLYQQLNSTTNFWPCTSLHGVKGGGGRNTFIPLRTENKCASITTLIFSVPYYLKEHCFDRRFQGFARFSF